MSTRAPKLNGRAHNAAPSGGLRIPPPDIAGANDGGGQSQLDASVGNEPVFSPAELEQLGFRRFNPLRLLTAEYLTAALDGYDSGILMAAARLWAVIAERDKTINSVKHKREEAVALRDWTVAPVDKSPAAADQAAVLKNFYAGITATHSLKRNTTGGFPLLVTQMMEGVSYGYAAHHLIWQPNAAAMWKLPASGKMVPTLTVQAEYVPLEFFEARSGELRFLGLSLGYTGVELDPQAWMVTTGPCLMQAASIIHFFSRLAYHDLINFSEKFGTPGVLVNTTSAQGSPGGEAAKALAQRMAGNYRGVLYGAAENKVEFLWPSGGTGGNNLPMTAIGEDAKRDLAILFLGADLSTMSKGGDGVGASIQGEEQQKRERADCARISETLNATLDRTVLRWYFGDGCPILAKVLIESPVNEDKTALLNAVSSMVALGALIPIAPIAKRLNVPIDESGPDFFAPPAAPMASISDPHATPATNVGPTKVPVRELIRSRETDGPTLGPLLARGRAVLAAGDAADMRPLTDAIKHVLGADDAELPDRAKKLYDALPHLGAQIIAANGSPEALVKILGAAAATGIASGPNPPMLSDDE